jgi:hypothetical protein
MVQRQTRELVDADVCSVLHHATQPLAAATSSILGDRLGVQHQKLHDAGSKALSQIFLFYL